MKIRNRLFLFLFAVLISISTFAEVPAVFQMPKDENVYFKSFSYTSSKYFLFSTNGTYQQINREHMYVKESDYGTWSQNESGEITLVSQDHYRNIECDPLSIFIWHTQALERLPWIKLQLTTLLANSENQTFTDEQIEGIEKYGYENFLSRVSVDDCTNRVSREKIGELIVLINQYLNNPKKNHLHVIPMTYKDLTFLIWKDAQTPINRDLKRIIEDIDNLTPDTLPAFIFIRIDQDTFQKESGETQEFIFYPEMNILMHLVKIWHLISTIMYILLVLFIIVGLLIIVLRKMSHVRKHQLTTKDHNKILQQTATDD